MNSGGEHLKGCKAILSAFALIGMTTQSMAATSLCVEDVSAGLTWKNGGWETASFVKQQYIVRDVDPREAIGHNCGSTLRQEKLHEEPVVEGSFQNWWACVGMAEVGEEMTAADVTYCKVLAKMDGEPFSINCDDAWSYQMFFQPSGEFQVTRSIEARIDWGGDTPRATMSVAAGKCSVIQP